MRGHSANGANVESILEFAQTVAVDINLCDVAGFLGQVLGEVAADFTGTKDDDFHDSVRLISRQK